MKTIQDRVEDILYVSLNGISTISEDTIDNIVSAMKTEFFGMGPLIINPNIYNDGTSLEMDISMANYHNLHCNISLNELSEGNQ